MPKRKRKSQLTVEEEFIVERIIKKRVVDGRTEYFLKWLGYPEDDNTWEPRENLSCEDLIEMFERSKCKEGGSGGEGSKVKLERSRDKDEESAAAKERLAKPKRAHFMEDSPTPSPRPKEESSDINGDLSNKVDVPDRDSEPSGFQRGLKAEDILGATEVNGQILFLVKWEGQQEADFVYSQEARNHIPLMVIDFYESKLTWHDAAAQDGLASK